ncbi:hypothetical protein CBM2592_B110009 [Cupriavidus taiwanensis]|nr:hypothetical protein CBM2588_B140004 [Cupriavidus taiwanensis]SOY63446.1 hypothetical protein CBM2592_B110009 [Cupriavidus taiwanensis]SOY98447.1 hypothetical protein CBM2591_B90009 [Cupriavidus taiwanensis]SOZ85312.1 hypothetical protein CBM2618_B130096 [Cupriavidus taiwanensis]SOZ88730.1 hypothetical protein CBM2622_B140099 [Cupriavidus taiwanensis]
MHSTGQAEYHGQRLGRTFLLSQKRTLQLSRYMCVSHNNHYVKSWFVWRNRCAPTHPPTQTHP